MKKIFAILLAVMLIAAMTAPVAAVTPDLGVPDMPEIPDLSDDVHVEIPEEVFDDYVEENPLRDIDAELPEETEPPAEGAVFDWHELLKDWFDKFPLKWEPVKPFEGNDEMEEAIKRWWP